MKRSPGDGQIVQPGDVQRVARREDQPQAAVRQRDQRGTLAGQQPPDKRGVIRVAVAVPQVAARYVRLVLRQRDQPAQTAREA